VGGAAAASAYRPCDLAFLGAAIPRVTAGGPDPEDHSGTRLYEVRHEGEKMHAWLAAES
jgi:hypothetical protein